MGIYTNDIKSLISKQLSKYRFCSHSSTDDGNSDIGLT